MKTSSHRMDAAVVIGYFTGIIITACAVSLFIMNTVLQIIDYFRCH